ncbi:hypothetical protein ACIBEA_42695 [Streptomyces sp. NPDC051555]|uniref:hypothetical protein n=1 Tax=Streptomyces sp. NPDC051555 TaxID=3365657 RepID=UPI00378B0A61
MENPEPIPEASTATHRTGAVERLASAANTFPRTPLVLVLDEVWALSAHLDRSEQEILFQGRRVPASYAPARYSAI